MKGVSENEALLMVVAERARTRRGTILFAAARQGEGTTYACVRCAESLSGYLADSRILLIDMNPLHPDLSRQCGAPQGWRDACSVPGGEITATKFTVPYFRDGFENVRVLAVGGGNSDTEPAEHTLNDRLPAMLKALAESYAVILLDCAPVLASPAALLAGRATGAAILVVEARRTRQPVVQLAAQRLREAGAELLGVVLNKRSFPVPGWLYRRFLS